VADTTSTTSRNRISSVTLHQLRVFAAVAHERSFAEAAHALCLSQPTVSEQIKLLETLLRARLFTRSRGRRPVELTRAGELLLYRYDAISETLEQAGREIELLSEVPNGVVTFGTGPAFGTHVLPRVHESFRRLYPSISVRIRIDVNNPALLESLRRRDLDLAVLVDPVDESGLEMEELARYDVPLIGLPGHRLASVARAPFSELASERLILPDESVAVRRAIDRLAAQTGTTLRVALEMNHIEARMQAVLDGLGIAPLNTYSVRATIETGQLATLRVQGFPLALHWHVVHAKGTLSPATEAFKSYLLRLRPILAKRSFPKGFPRALSYLQ
jgi:DNA-binding transcriptional LysR family regulator